MLFAGLKKWFQISAVLSAAGASSISASALRLAWNPSNSPDVVEYRVYVGTLPGQYPNFYSAGSLTSFSAINLVPGLTYHFAVTAVNRAGLESDLSAPVSGLAPLTGPAVTGLVAATGSFEVRVQGIPLTSYIVEQSQNLNQWAEVVNAGSDVQGRLVYRSQLDRPRSFFRVRPQ